MTELAPHPPWRISVRLLVVSVVLLTTLVTAAVAIGLHYYFSRNMAIDNAVETYQTAARHTGEFIKAVERRATQITRLLSRYPYQSHLLQLQAESPGHMPIAELFGEVMRSNPIYFSVYVGLPNGDFYEVINLENSVDMRANLKADPDDRWVINRVSDIAGVRMRRLDYFDANFRWRSSRQEPSNYDTRQRRWFNDARHGKVNKTRPYIFHYPQVPGQTYSIKLPGSDIVLAIDITLQALSDYLRQQPLSREGEIYLYKASGEIIASNQLGVTEDSIANVAAMPLTPAERAYIDKLGAIKVSNQQDWPPVDFAVAGQPRGYTVDLLRLAAAKLDLKINFINGYSWTEILEQYDRGKLDIVQPIADNSQNRVKGVMSEPIVRLPLAMAFREGDESFKSTAPLQLESLAGKTLAIPRGWSSIFSIRQVYPDISVVEVESLKEALEYVRDGKADATLDSAAVLKYTANQYFMDGLVFVENVDTGKAQLPEDFRLLVQPGLRDLVSLLESAIRAIEPTPKAWLRQKWLDVGVESHERFVTVPYKTLLKAPAQPDNLFKPLEISIRNEPRLAYIEQLDPENPQSDYFAVVIPQHKVLGESLDRVSLSVLITGAFLLLLLPVSWLFAEPIVRPMRQLFDKSIRVKERRYAEITYQPNHVSEIDDLLRSMVDMAESIQQYELDQRNLMDSFIQLIAEAIDEKSPYTGGHCARVPELALMLAEKAAASDDPAFRDFGFASDDEYREFKIAAWLHDCGKITVPEHVVDKGSKLETIYNRIHEIRMRFEVLWRDAEIDYYRALIATPEQAQHHAKQLIQRQQSLRDDFTFVANTNVGGEFLNDEARERLRTLAQVTWQRNFDDRLGLSPVEEMRVSSDPQALPAKEYLLADKPEHLISRYRPMEDANKFGIRMDIPEHLYNLGEVYNLSVSRGTLTAEDRFKINEHMISTIRMLEKLPFPADLARVPRYASTHHETLKGTGYPRKLAAQDLSLPERMIAVADVFEALTAADRPYKKAKTVSESIAILYHMVQDNHLDRDVFELFLKEGIYRDYAERFLAAEQMDEVDVKRYLRIATA